MRRTAIANGTYGKHVAGCYEDSLDEKGKIMTDAKKKKKLMEGRNKRRAHYAGDRSHTHGATAALLSPSVPLCPPPPPQVRRLQCQGRPRASTS